MTQSEFNALLIERSAIWSGAEWIMSYGMFIARFTREATIRLKNIEEKIGKAVVE